MKCIIELDDFKICLKIKDLEVREIFFIEDQCPEEVYIFSSRGEEEVFKRAKEQLMEYFRGERQGFDLIFHENGSRFEELVWNVIRKIPYGETISYTKLAQRCGMPEAVRSVASAVGRNKLLIITPCHRVILKSGEIGNYSGGTNRKKILIEREQKFNKSI
ncbi:MAG: methylated-DNA--[protein]-cysteine S-methyltransferase [Candidatus Stygibacter australis]|nr:methylated-DNA--[protein]-cysteine S-methyltransferase [Candidatus Stygibacter australis]MDP8320734.1 methylated-DNA--[protein]-cysteine S-methyltransferase [Candidatus Stygibacter australis]